MRTVSFFRRIIGVIVGRSSFSGGSAMRILVPWKPVVLVWGLLSGMILVSFVASSLLAGKDPFASAKKTGVAQTAQQPSRSHKAAQTPSR